MEKKYEYMHRAIAASELTRVLNELGAEGWKVVKCDPPIANSFNPELAQYTVLLERAKTSEKQLLKG